MQTLSYQCAGRHRRTHRGFPSFAFACVGLSYAFLLVQLPPRAVSLRCQMRSGRSPSFWALEANVCPSALRSLFDSRGGPRNSRSRPAQVGTGFFVAPNRKDNFFAVGEVEIKPKGSSSVVCTFWRASPFWPEKVVPTVGHSMPPP